MHNIILNSDSYKYSQFNQYPPGTEYMYSYIESRGGKYDETVFFGLQAFIMEYLLQPVTMDMIDEAELVITAHGEPFYREGWEYIVEKHAGMLPVAIKAVPEGTVVSVSNVLVTMVNTDPNCWWLTNFLETALLRAVWYPTTVSTNSREIKKVIAEYLEKTGDIAGIDFKLHDFGARGVSSLESAGIGGAAHLVNFMGTDTIEALLFARTYYGAEMAAFSIPAMEHSTVTTWGREHEVDSFRNMLKRHAKPGGLVACVSDSYDIYGACHKWGTELKQDVIDSGATVIIRPDSGDPATVVVRCLEILGEHFGYVINDKGYAVLNNVRVIQGDGINIDSIKAILHNMELHKFSADNVAFGQGGALLQIVNRDDQKFAMKCSAARINGKWIDVYKDPITDNGKRSKRGILKLIGEKGNYITLTGDTDSYIFQIAQDVLEPVFENGKMLRYTSFEEVRKNATL